MKRHFVVILLVLGLLSRPRHAPAAEIVFDPTNFGANVEQVLHHLEVIARLDEQIRNQFRMLENWRFSLLDELLGSMLAIRGPLDSAGSLDLARRYPIVPRVYAQRDTEAMRQLKRQWLEAQRRELAHAQALQNQVVAEMPRTQSRVAQYVERSNSAPGQTAAIQASNEVLATLAGQLQTLQAMEISQTRIELEDEAHRQAQAAFQRQRRAAMMRDWPTTTTTNRPAPAVPALFGRNASK